MYNSIRNGAVVGLINAFYSIYSDISKNSTVNFSDIIDIQGVIFYASIGQIIGNIIGGAFLFGVIALIRNYFVKH